MAFCWCWRFFRGCRIVDGLGIAFQDCADMSAAALRAVSLISSAFSAKFLEPAAVLSIASLALSAAA